MDGARRTRYSRRTRRLRRFRRSRRGVVSVVGTLLSMLVFFALFGVFITQYVPIWMTQNESQFTFQAQASMEQLKQYVDNQAIFGGPHTYAVSFTMTSQGIPLFAQPTQGSVAYVGAGCAGGFTPPAFLNILWKPASVGACTFEHLGFWNNVSGLSANKPLQQPFNVSVATNYLQMQLPNRYFPGENIFFENDATIAAQAGGQQLLLVGPPLNLTHSTGNTSFTASLVTLAGSPSSIATQGTKDVYASFISNSNYSSVGRFPNALTSPATTLPFNVSFDVGTRDQCAWFNLLTGLAKGANETLNPGAGWLVANPYPASYATLNTILPSGAQFNQTGAQTTSFCGNAAGKTYEIAFTIFNVNFAQAYTGVSQLSFSSGGL